MRTVCAILMLFLGLGHQPAGAAVPIEAFSEAYRLPDGSFAEICLEGEQHHRSLLPARCEVCLLAASILLPPPDDQAWLPGPGQWIDNPLPFAEGMLGPAATLRPRSRAPPSAA